jgi:hypothetical protein
VIGSTGVSSADGEKCAQAAIDAVFKKQGTSDKHVDGRVRRIMGEQGWPDRGDEQLVVEVGFGVRTARQLRSAKPASTSVSLASFRRRTGKGAADREISRGVG